MNMDMKHIKMNKDKMNKDKINTALSRQCFIIKKTQEENIMLKLLAKIAEKYAKNTNTACVFWGMLHQPKMPASLIKKDQ